MTLAARAVGLAALAVLVALPLAADEAPPTADPSQQAVLAHLERTRTLFQQAIAGLGPEQWAWKPAADRWSVGECAEHITRTEALLRGQIEQGLAEPLPAEQIAKGRGKSGAILAMVVDRSQRFQAPEPLNPMQGGEVRSHEQLARDFAAERALTVALASAHTDLEALAVAHPFLEVVDLAGWLYFISAHAERHTLQIEEVKATPGFPGG